MGKIIGICIAGFLSLVAVTCSANRIEPGHVGIIVNLYGTDKGVSSYPVVTGMQFVNPLTTQIFEYPTYVQTARWEQGKDNSINEGLTIRSKPGTSFLAEVSLSYQLKPENVPGFYVKFRSDKLDNFTHGFLRNVARDAFAEESALLTDEELYATKKEELLQKTRARINRQVEQYGVELVQLGFINGPNPPASVVEGINQKAVAIQNAVRVENELRSIQAEAAKNVAQAQGDAQAAIARAEGQAKANRIISESTSSTVMEWQKLKIQEWSIDKWNGALPSTVTSGAIPFVSVK